MKRKDDEIENAASRWERHPVARRGFQTRARLAQAHSKRDLNQELFNIIAPRYDLITRLLSFGRDAAWKDRLLASLPIRPTAVCVDLACGTGDLTFQLAAKYPQAQIVGLDLTESMLVRARARSGDATRIQFLQGDMAQTGLASDSVDLVTGGYALRNAGDLDEALTEICRILKPNGLAAFLDFSKPQGKLLQRMELALLKFWGGLWGVVFHRNPGVYAYIAESLRVFPDRRQLAEKCRAHGFEILSSELHFFGIMQRLTLIKTPVVGSVRESTRASAAREDARPPVPETCRLGAREVSCVGSFATRADLIEEMDRPETSEVLLRRTLAQFGTVNRMFSRYRTLLRRYVLDDMKIDKSRVYRLVDLGAGGCDIDRWLVDCCRQQGLQLRITAVERDARVLRFAQQANAGYPEIELVDANALEGDFLAGADYVFANHLLHHLSREACIELIRRIDRAAPRAYVLSDILRSRLAYGCYACAAPLFFRNSFVVPDGLASIRRSFTVAEAHALAQAAAPVHPVTVRRLVPGRLAIVGGVSAA